MQQKVLVVLVCFYVLISGCKKKSDTPDSPPEPTKGTISNLKIGDLVLPKSKMKLSVFAANNNKAGCQYSDNFSLFINHESLTGSYSEKIIVSRLSPQRLGIKKVLENNFMQCDTTVHADIYIGNDDFILYRYVALKKAQNTITLSSYDSKTKEVAGTFDITFVNLFGTPDSRLTYPDTIRIHDCQFRTVINE